jgi:hypothetical protein
VCLSKYIEAILTYIDGSRVHFDFVPIKKQTSSGIQKIKKIAHPQFIRIHKPQAAANHNLQNAAKGNPQDAAKYHHEFSE